jgi:hypothetical protein
MSALVFKLFILLLLRLDHLLRLDSLNIYKDYKVRILLLELKLFNFFNYWILDTLYNYIIYIIFKLALFKA